MLAAPSLRDRRHDDEDSEIERCSRPGRINAPGQCGLHPDCADAPVVAVVVLSFLRIFAVGPYHDGGRADHDLDVLGVSAGNGQGDAHLVVALVHIDRRSD